MFPDAQARVVAGIERIAARHRRGAVVVATHGDIVRIAIADFTAAPLDEFQRIVIDTAAVSVVELGGPRPHVLLVNDTGGLARFRAAPTPPWDAAGRDRRGGSCEDSSMDLGQVDRITADAIGEPGMRTFYLQARAGEDLLTVVVEKEQVELLARSVLELLVDAPMETAIADVDDDAQTLEDPVDPRFRAGRLSIGFDNDEDRFLLEIDEYVARPRGPRRSAVADPGEEPDSVRTVGVPGRCSRSPATARPWSLAAAPAASSAATRSTRRATFVRRRTDTERRRT